MTFLSSPLEQFEVTPLISITAPVRGNFVLALTNFGLYAVITVIFVLGLHILGTNAHYLVPNRYSISIESAYSTTQKIVQSQIGSLNEIYIPTIYAFIWLILIGNLNGNVPYGYTVTTSLITSLGLSIIIFLAVTILGLSLHRIHFFSYFVPENTPLALVPILVIIELISYLARAVSLGVRLFSNTVAGHTLLKILATFLGQLFTYNILTAILTLIPFAVFVSLIGLEIAVSFIQAYVFVVLTSSYIHDAIELH